MKKIILLVLIAVTVVNIAYAQTKDKMTLFLAGFTYKNWIGVAEEKNDRPNWKINSNVKFTFYVNGNMKKESKSTNGKWNTINGKWQLYKSGETWMMKVMGTEYRLIYHFADSDEKERLELLNEEDFKKGRTINVFTLKANGYK